jgi:subtilisin-like proprotein convertase family protein
MKKLFLLGGLMLATTVAQATLFSVTWNSGFANGGVIPDGNATGWSDTRTVTMTGVPDNIILDVNVRLNISGGYNGDLYAYLVHSSGFSILLNRSGKTGSDAFGYGDAGYNITLDDDAANGNIHLYQTALNPNGAALTGIWAPDARNVNPATVLDTDTPSSGAMLGTFNGLNGNGTWTLFLADMAGGDVSTIQSWGLDISVVPEPTTWAMIIFGGVALLGWVRKQRRMTEPQQARAAAVVRQ